MCAVPIIHCRPATAGAPASFPAPGCVCWTNRRKDVALEWTEEWPHCAAATPPHPPTLFSHFSFQSGPGALRSQCWETVAELISTVLENETNADPHVVNSVGDGNIWRVHSAARLCCRRRSAVNIKNDDVNKEAASCVTRDPTC